MVCAIHAGCLSVDLAGAQERPGAQRDPKPVPTWKVEPMARVQRAPSASAHKTAGPRSVVLVQTLTPPARANPCNGQLARTGPGCALSELPQIGARSILDGVSQWVATSAAWLLSQVGGVLTSTTRIQISSRWYLNSFALMYRLAAFLALPILLLAVIRAVLRQDPSGLARSVLVHLPLALLLTGVAVEVVQLSLGAVDELSNAVASGAGMRSGEFMQKVITMLAASTSPEGAFVIPAFVLLIVAIAIALGSFLLWIELLVRSAAVYVAVLFLPLALAGVSFPTVSHWSRRLAETLTALILSKLVIVAILSLATEALAAQGATLDLAGLMGAVALLMLATLAPFALLKLVPMVEAGAVSHMEGTGRRVASSVGSNLVGHARNLAGRFAGWGGSGEGVGVVDDNPSGGFEPGGGPRGPLAPPPGSSPGGVGPSRASERAGLAGSIPIAEGEPIAGELYRNGANPGPKGASLPARSQALGSQAVDSLDQDARSERSQAAFQPGAAR